MFKKQELQKKNSKKILAKNWRCEILNKNVKY